MIVLLALIDLYFSTSKNSCHGAYTDATHTQSMSKAKHATHTHAYTGVHTYTHNTHIPA